VGKVELLSLPNLREYGLGGRMATRLIFTVTRLKPKEAYVASMEYMPGIRKTFISQSFNAVLKEVAHAPQNPVETYFKEQQK